ncbi:MAG: FAD-dependent oxidoreductase [Clostridiales bacterium]|jgi:hypothetical protein|nr:FAD-dependent oxidoreductase [Clostridiales bacterium]
MNLSFSRELPLYARYDVIVAGGGPAGCAAAIASAREGARTLLIEDSGALGGMGTIGLVPAWCPFTDQEKVIYRGVAWEVFESLKAESTYKNTDIVDWAPIDAETLKRVYDRLVTEAGAEVLFNTRICDVVMDENEPERLDCLVAANKRGLMAYRADMFVDCTGDADIIAFAGLTFACGDEKGQTQPATHCFILSNIDEDAYLAGPELHMSKRDSPVYDIARSDKYPLVTDGHSCNNLIGQGTVGFNAGHIWGVDSTNPESVSKALMHGRALAHEFHEGLKEFCPGVYADSFLVSTAPAIGIRESRRVIGEYTLSMDDYLRRRSFPDEIGRNAYFIDVHYTEDKRAKVVSGELNEEDAYARYKPGESHGIPFRCLTPKGLVNVLTAGRNISCDHQILGSVRVMPPCLVTGQAAGTAAAMAAGLKTNVKGLAVDALRGQLRKNGAYFI